MNEMNDYSGEFLPGLRFEDFSKTFLLSLIKHWQWAWMHMDHGFFEQFVKRNELGKAFDMDMAGWLRVATLINPVFTEVARIPVSTVVDCHKALQLPLDNTMGELWSTTIKFVDEYESVHDVPACPALDWIEDHAPERITGLCQLDRQVIERYKINMEVELTPVRLPPRANKGDSPCAWRMKKHVPEDTPRRPIEELVDWTETPPEVDDLAGPLYPNLTHENFSKDFLLRLMNAWQYAWHTMVETHFLTARKEHGYDAAMEIAAAAWARSTRGIQERYAQCAGVKLETVLDSLKLLQIGLDSATGPLYRVSYDILDENHVIIEIAEHAEMPHPDWPLPRLDVALAAGDWTERIKSMLLNPAIGVEPLDSVPQPGDESIKCRWELKLDNPAPVHH